MEQGDKCLISLPGVPREMEYLAENEVFPYLRQRYRLTGTIKARVLHTAGMGESLIDEQVGEFELLANPTVGLAAHYGMVDVRITAKAESDAQADGLIAGVEKTIRERLGPAIYGADEQTLEGVTLQAVARRGWQLAIVEVNTGGELSSRLSETGDPAFLGGEILPALDPGQTLAEAVEAQMKLRSAGAALGVIANQAPGNLGADLVFITPDGRKQSKRSYGGHPKNIPAWAANQVLDLLRRALDD